ncbi:MAG: UDP-N-acetylglucosamine--N-acetylmuramyl-(pentapeptide) pyrophosphoryl-undecaprenol N-acetylglucosamine transferase [Candidatus Pacebacteria bacterium]|nr:UDP-N-acetylglucosamine--N-acetylmuramyl-(pentapeptide) pyrophosphoryl-undecaprenol N-acetylglucosamine transferase [Candidatus Paceibacterota bacterium]
MKIVLTGGGTGGHFYPLIAVAEEMINIIDNQNIADARIYYLSDKPYDKKALYQNGINFKKITAGKLKGIDGYLKIMIGIFEAILTLFSIYPDAVFSKGGYSAFPTVFAAKLLGIPVIVHESDSVPGKVNKWAGKFARAVAVSYKQEVDYFPKDKIIHTGQPIRHDLLEPTVEGAHEFLNLEKETPVIWILGGSQGAQAINLAMEETLGELLNDYQIVHQVGKNNYDDMKKLTDATLLDHDFKYRYHIFDHLNTLSMKMMAGVSDIVISRAGSALFEIAHWEIPAIIIPLKNSAGNHQIKNAYNYARMGGCIVIEENNMSDQLLIFEIKRIIHDEKIRNNMKAGAQAFDIENASEKIAEEIIGIALAHEK